MNIGWMSAGQVWEQVSTGKHVRLRQHLPIIRAWRTNDGTYIDEAFQDGRFVFVDDVADTIAAGW